MLNNFDAVPMRRHCNELTMAYLEQIAIEFLSLAESWRLVLELRDVSTASNRG